MEPGKIRSYYPYIKFIVKPGMKLDRVEKEYGSEAENEALTKRLKAAGSKLLAEGCLKENRVDRLDVKGFRHIKDGGKTPAMRPMPPSSIGIDGVDQTCYKKKKEIKSELTELYRQEPLDTERVRELMMDSYKFVSDYMVQRCYTESDDVKNMRQIVNDVYMMLRQSAITAAVAACRSEGEPRGESINTNPTDRGFGWSYYNADYYYKSEELIKIAEQCAEEFSSEHKLGAADLQIYAGHSMATDIIDFNTCWSASNISYGYSGIEAGAEPPPRGLKVFWSPFCKIKNDYVDIVEYQLGNGERQSVRKSVFETTSTGKSSCPLSDFFPNAGKQSKDYKQVKKFFSQFHLLNKGAKYGEGSEELLNLLLKNKEFPKRV